jgi:hypothetical protein
MLIILIEGVLIIVFIDTWIIFDTLILEMIVQDLVFKFALFVWVI